MKTIDLFCASPASTAICSSMDQRAMIRHGTRPIDRGIGGRRTTGAPPVPCPSPLPIDSKPYYQRSRSEVVRRKSSADSNFNGGISPVGSSRYLLSDHKPFIDFLSDSSDHVSALMAASQTVTPRLQRRLSSNDSPVISSSSTLSRPRDQVVELRVSIHCKGCEGKVRKHISRMEGVTSYSIDLATKKVTVIGDVTPLGVLTSISRVKSAQFWPSPISSSSSSQPMLGLR